MLWALAPAALAALAPVSPPRGSLCGGTRVRVAAEGTDVRFGPAPCAVVEAGGGSLECVTTSLASASTTRVDVVVDGRVVGSFVYDEAATPIVTGVGPTAAQGGDVLSFIGHGLGEVESVEVGTEAATVRVGEDLLVQAVVPRLPVGDLAVRVRTKTGDACATHGSPPLKVKGLLDVQSVRSGRGSFGGGGDLVVVGRGLERANLTLCAQACTVTTISAEPREIHAGEDYQVLTCRPQSIPPCSAKEKTCELSLEAGGQLVKWPDAWTYVHGLTPLIRSATASQGKVVINGEGFRSPIAVTIDQQPCTVAVVREDYIECAAEVLGKVEVVVVGSGMAVPAHPDADVLRAPTPPARIPAVPLKAYTHSLCRAETVGSDCPPGWSCCPAAELKRPLGVCAAVCAPSFLART